MCFTQKFWLQTTQKTNWILIIEYDDANVPRRLIKTNKIRSKIVQVQRRSSRFFNHNLIFNFCVWIKIVFTFDRNN